MKPNRAPAHSDHIVHSTCPRTVGGFTDVDARVYRLARYLNHIRIVMLELWCSEHSYGRCDSTSQQFGAILRGSSE